MSTRSIIAVPLKEDNKYLAVYCHHDGYPDGVGKTLVENYSDYDMALQLVKHGNISSLEASLEKPDNHTFDNKIDGYTVFYGRDRGEDGQEPKEVTYQELRKLDWGQEYTYIFTEEMITYTESDWKWKCIDEHARIDLYKKSKLEIQNERIEKLHNLIADTINKMEDGELKNETSKKLFTI